MKTLIISISLLMSGCSLFQTEDLPRVKIKYGCGGHTMLNESNSIIKDLEVEDAAKLCKERSMCLKLIKKNSRGEVSVRCSK